MKRNVLLAVLAFFMVPVFAADIRVEPSCWWIAMSRPDLQLMLYGKDVGELSPGINYPGVRIVSVTQVENKNYLFVEITIDPGTAAAGKFPIEDRKVP